MAPSSRLAKHLRSCLSVGSIFGRLLPYLRSFGSLRSLPSHVTISLTVEYRLPGPEVLSPRGGHVLALLRERDGRGRVDEAAGPPARGGDLDFEASLLC